MFGIHPLLLLIAGFRLPNGCYFGRNPPPPPTPHPSPFSTLMPPLVFSDLCVYLFVLYFMHQVFVRVKDNLVVAIRKGTRAAHLPTPFPLLVRVSFHSTHAFVGLFFALFLQVEDMLKIASWCYSKGPPPLHTPIPSFHSFFPLGFLATLILVFSSCTTYFVRSRQLRACYAKGSPFPTLLSIPPVLLFFLIHLHCCVFMDNGLYFCRLKTTWCMLFQRTAPPPFSNLLSPLFFVAKLVGVVFSCNVCFAG